MKISEINQPKQIDESLAGALFGEVPMAALKGLFTEKGGKHQLAQDIFLRDFYQDALTSLDNGIKSGYVDPNKPYNPQPQANPQPQEKPAGNAAVPTTSPTQVPPAQQTGQQMNPQQTATAKMQTRAGIQPTGQKMTAAQRTQAQLQARKMKAAQKPKPVKESKFEKLNHIFESMISEMEGEATTSITDHMLEWFGMYMDGVNWESKKAAILPQIQKIQDTYGTDKGKAAIKNLARLAYSISGKSGTAPAGAQNAVQNVAPSLQSNRKTNPDQLAADLAALQPREREEVLAKVKAATK